MLDLTDPPAAGTIVSGSTWSLQFWYRDPEAGGALFNLSGGLTLAFQ